MEKKKANVKEFKPMTLEERREQAARAYAQKRESIATGVLFNALHNQEMHIGDITPEELAGYAIEVADKFIEKLYFTQE